MKKQLYHFGVNADSPFHAITLGGVTFTRRTAKVSFDENGDTIRSYVDGHYARLTLEQVDRIKKAAANHYVRMVGEEDGEDGARQLAAPIVYQLNPTGRRFREKGPHDEPVSKWIYIEPAAESPHAIGRRPTLAESQAADAQAEHPHEGPDGRLVFSGEPEAEQPEPAPAQEAPEPRRRKK